MWMRHSTPSASRRFAAPSHQRADRCRPALPPSAPPPKSRALPSRPAIDRARSAVGSRLAQLAPLRSGHQVSVRLMNLIRLRMRLRRRLRALPGPAAECVVVSPRQKRPNRAFKNFTSISSVPVEQKVFRARRPAGPYGTDGPLALAEPAVTRSARLWPRRCRPGSGRRGRTSGSRRRPRSPCSSR